MQTVARGLDLTAAPWLPGLTPPSCSGQAFPGTGNVAPTPFQFSQSVSVSVSVSSVQFSYAMNPGGPEGAKRRLWAAQGGLRAVRTGAKDLDLAVAS